MRRKAVILISGRGSNMAALVEAAQAPDYPVEIAGVLSDRADARGLNAASVLGIATAAIERAGHADKASHEAALEAELVRLGADIVCLAGYMRLFSPGFTERWAGRLINIHPSLLPLFKGFDTHARALEAGLRIHGCTVHFVTADMDGGPIVAQAAVPVLPGDDADTLGQRVLGAEHRLYPLALRLVAEGKARMEDGRTVLRGVAAQGTLLSPGPAGEEVDIESLARMTP